MSGGSGWDGSFRRRLRRSDWFLTSRMSVRLILCVMGAASFGALAQSDPDTDPALGTGTIGETGIVRGALEAGAGEAPVLLGIIGDFGSRTPAQRSVAVMLKSWQPDAVLTVGDNNYLTIEPRDVMDNAPDGRPLNGWQLAVGDDYGEFLARRADAAYPEQRSATTRLFPSVGNHDRPERFDTPRALSGFYDYFRDNPGGAPRLPDDRNAVFSETLCHYAVRLGPVDCFFLDSNPPAEVSEAAAGLLIEQRRWLAAQVAASTARWKIACFHHPPYSSGSHGSNPRMQWPELSSLDALFCGHDHLYERLVCSENGSDTGPVLVISGNGGADLYPFREPLPQSRVRHANAFGALRMTADERGLAIEAWAVDPQSNDRRLLDSTSLGTLAKRDPMDDYWFVAPRGLTVEAAVTTDRTAPSNAPAVEVELWAPDGTRAAAGPPPLRHVTGDAGRWRVRVRARAAESIAYTLSLTQPAQEAFEAWEQRRTRGKSGRPSAPSADVDRDGMDALTEFALGTDPTARDAGAPGVSVDTGRSDLIEIRVSPPAIPAPGTRLILEERFQPPGKGTVQWLERLVLAPWQPRSGIEAWEEVPAPEGRGAASFVWQRARGPAALNNPVFRWRAVPVPAP